MAGGRAAFDRESGSHVISIFWQLFQVLGYSGGSGLGSEWRHTQLRRIHVRQIANGNTQCSVKMLCESGSRQSPEAMVIDFASWDAGNADIRTINAAYGEIEITNTKNGMYMMRESLSHREEDPEVGN